MEKKRVEKGEKYWFIHIGDFNPCVMWDWEDGSIYADARYDNNNYFSTENEANICASKIELVFAGADVIEMPSEEEVTKHYADMMAKHYKEYNLSSSTNTPKDHRIAQIINRVI